MNGYKMVPVEPTEEVLISACAIPGVSLETGKRMYAAFTAAAPPATVVGEPLEWKGPKLEPRNYVEAEWHATADGRDYTIEMVDEGRYFAGVTDGPYTTLEDAKASVLVSPPAPSTYRDALIDVMASLAAAISLLERGDKAAKKAAPSDKMFDQMLADYRASLDRACRIAGGA